MCHTELHAKLSLSYECHTELHTCCLLRAHRLLLGFPSIGAFGLRAVSCPVAAALPATMTEPWEHWLLPALFSSLRAPGRPVCSVSRSEVKFQEVAQCSPSVDTIHTKRVEGSQHHFAMSLVLPACNIHSHTAQCKRVLSGWGQPASATHLSVQAADRGG